MRAKSPPNARKAKAVNAHEMTWRQYRNFMIDNARKEHGCTRAEAAECYPDEMVKTEWLRQVVRAAEGGEAISHRILDDIAKSGMWFQFSSDARDYRPPASYMLPWVRSQPSALDVRRGRAPA